MNRIAEEIFIRTVSGVLIVLIVVLIFEFISKRKKPCGCKGKETPAVDTPPASAAQGDYTNPLTLIHF